MADEEIIKRRLLIDGDGTGDDRRLTLLFKNFVKWNTTINESPAEINAMKEKLLGQLSHIRLMHMKTKMVSRMNKIELDKCSALSKEIERQIEDVKLVIKNSKEELHNAKVVRKHRSEYDMIASVIQKHPERKETSAKLAQLNKELTALQETEHEFDNKLEIRRKHFHVLVASLNQLHTMFVEENENSVEDPHIDISDDDEIGSP